MAIRGINQTLREGLHRCWSIFQCFEISEVSKRILPFFKDLEKHNKMETPKLSF